MGCAGHESAVDALLNAAVELFNAPASLRDPYSRANDLDRAVFPVAKLADDFDADVRLRDRATPGEPEGGGGERPAGPRKPGRSVSEGAVEALLGDESQQVLNVARSGQSADDKMRAICGIDRRFLAYTSAQWADLLEVSDAAIRKTPFWRHDRPQAIKADRELKEE
jgi:hypothetical protein